MGDIALRHIDLVERGLGGVPNMPDPGQAGEGLKALDWNKRTELLVLGKIGDHRSTELLDICR